MTPESEKLVVRTTNLFATQLGERLKAIRKKMELKQSAFANLIGLSNDTISSIERNRKLPRLETLCAIAERLEMTLSELVNFQDESKAKQAINQPLETHIRNLKTKTPAEIRWFDNLARVAFNYPIRIKRKRGR